MAEERNVGLARAQEATVNDDDANATKEELQRRMEEARESITQTVAEIKDSVTTQYQSVRESLDWREQYRRRPAAFSAGALGVGLLVGYSVGGAFVGGKSDDDYYEDDDYMSSSPTSYVPPSYASQAITGSSAYAKSGAAEPRSYGVRKPENADQYSSSTAESTTPPTATTEYNRMSQPEKPGLLARFKETQAFDRLQSELSTLGSRAVDELSQTAQAVVLPALLGKLKDMIGIDLSMQKREAERSQLEKQTTASRAESAKTSEQQNASQQSSNP